jgi:peptide deformylase
MQPSHQKRELGIVQHGDELLTRPAQHFELPTEHDEAQAVVGQLLATMGPIGRVHPFAKGMGIAAPQIGIARAAAVVQPPGPGAPVIVLLNPRIIAHAADTDEQYEGCLSFFDVRGLVPRPLSITVQTTTLDGRTETTKYQHGLARLIHHEIDHLDGLLYLSRMRPGVEPLPVEEYRQTGQAWSYGT